MRQYIFRLLAALCCLAAAGRLTADEPAALSGRDLFVNLPGDALDLIPRATRTDMVDFYEAGKKYRPKNALGGECELLKLTPSYVLVQPSSVSSVQICLLPKGKSRVVAVVCTVDGQDSPDSEIYFLNSSLEPLPTHKFFAGTTLADFLNVKGAKARELEALVPFLLVSYKLISTSRVVTLTATLNIEDSMTREDFKRLSPYIAHTEITYIWQDGKFLLPASK